MILPAGLIAWLGRIMGNIGFYLDKKHRAIAYTNVRIAFGDTKNIKELNRIVKGSFQNFAQNLFELLRLPIIDSKYVDRFVKIEGKEFIDRAIQKQKGLILLAVHFGSWELANAVCAISNYPYKLVVREQAKFRRLNSLLNSYRQLKKCEIISRGDQTRDIIRALKNNEIAVMVIDQGGKDGTPIKFFNKTASTHTGPLRLALKFDIPVIMSFIIREKGEQHRIVLHPLHLEKTGDLGQDIRTNLRNIIQITEEMICKYPEQYLWFYKIWKYSNERLLVILTDGKIGHLRQSQAVSKIILNELSQRKLDVQIKTIQIKFKNNFSKLIVNLSSRFFCREDFCGHIRYLKYFLEQDSFNNLIEASADFVVSCGSSIAPVNLFLSKETRAKSIVILRPGLLNPKRFNLAIIPKHDSPPKVKNIAETDGAVNLINEEYLKEQSELFIKRFPFLKPNNKKRLGIFIGGETKNYTISDKLTGIIIEQIKSVSERLDLEILLTTSRRTSRQIDRLLRNSLANYSRCRLLVIANENNFPEAVGGILGLSQIIAISADSISMVSEAASSGKAVVVFRSNLKKNSRPNLRHEKFLDNLLRKEHIVLVEPEEITETIEDIIKNNKTTNILKDSQIITEAIRQVL